MKVGTGLIGGAVFQQVFNIRVGMESKKSADTSFSLLPNTLSDLFHRQISAAIIFTWLSRS